MALLGWWGSGEFWVLATSVEQFFCHFFLRFLVLVVDTIHSIISIYFFHNPGRSPG